MYKGDEPQVTKTKTKNKKDPRGPQLQANSMLKSPLMANRSNTQRDFDPSMQCPNHKQPYKNYCMSDHEPLCYLCIQDHDLLHKQVIGVEFIPVSMEDALNGARDKMAVLRDMIQEKLDAINTEDILAHLQDMVQMVIVAKKEMITEINKVAQKQLKNIETIELKYRKIHLKKPFIEAAEVINKHIDNLHNAKKVEEVQLCYLFDEANFRAHFNSIVSQNKIELEKSKCEIIYDKFQFKKLVGTCFRLDIPSYGNPNQEDEAPKDFQIGKPTGGKIFESFVVNLNRAVQEENGCKIQRMKEYAQKNSNKPINFKPSENKLIQQQAAKVAENQMRKLIVQDQPNQNIMPDNPNPDFNQIKNALNISLDRYHKYVHYFEVGSYNLHLYSLDQGIFYTRKLKLEHPIPYYHKSVQGPGGTIYLSGGRKDLTKKSVRNRNLFCYNIAKDVSQINITNLEARSSHSLVQHKGVLYILGGFNQISYISVVQAIDGPDTTVVRYVQPSTFAGECISASVGDFIWKISVDGLQLYDPIKDKWRHVIINNFLYFDSSMCVCINHEQLFVFGGYDTGERGVRNSYIMKQTKQFETLEDAKDQYFVIEKKDVFKLIQGQGFSDCNVAVSPGNLYVYCNNSNGNNQIVTDQKNLITFNGVKWKFVPKVDVE